MVGVDTSEPAAESPRARRLPTKTRSGVIALPTSHVTSASTSSTQPPGESLPSPSSRACEATSTSSSDTAQQRPGSCEEASAILHDVHDARGQQGQPSSVTLRIPKLTGPKPVPKPPSITGPLNATTTPQAKALPVKRRGSYQSLKRNSGSSQFSTEDEPSVFSLFKKVTHWEKFGTLLVLYCSKDKSDGQDEVLQMLMAEGYDTEVVDNQQDILSAFSSREVFPDIVIIDADNLAFNTSNIIKQLQAQNPTVATLILASAGTRPGSICALQAGAADYMQKPLNLEELIARVERHVSRQHAIKLELETALENAKDIMAQVMPAAVLGDMVLNTSNHQAQGRQRLIAVAETDFEAQMSELSEENQRLGSKLQDMERKLEMKDVENAELNARLNAISQRLDDRAQGYGKQLDLVTEQNQSLMHKVDELEKMVKHSSMERER